jgi:hypothetical protein
MGEGRAKIETEMSCLFALRIEGGQLSVEEFTKKPNLVELAREAISVLESVADPTAPRALSGSAAPT